MPLLLGEDEEDEEDGTPAGRTEDTAVLLLPPAVIMLAGGGSLLPFMLEGQVELACVSRSSWPSSRRGINCGGGEFCGTQKLKFGSWLTRRWPRSKP